MSTDSTRIMLEIWTRDYPGLAELDSAQHADGLRDFVRTRTTDGTLDSRTSMHELIHRLACWMIHDLGLADQQLLEQLESIIGSTSDEYRSWSPEYNCPITNSEADLLTSEPDWAHVLREVDRYDVHNRPTTRLAEAFIPVGDNQIGLAVNIDLRMDPSDWLALVDRQRAK